MRSPGAHLGIQGRARAIHGFEVASSPASSPSLTTTPQSTGPAAPIQSNANAPYLIPSLRRLTIPAPPSTVHTRRDLV